jgi:hypothetical protein
MIQSERLWINNYNSCNNLPMKTKLSDYHTLVDLETVCGKDVKKNCPPPPRLGRLAHHVPCSRMLQPSMSTWLTDWRKRREPGRKTPGHCCKVHGSVKFRLYRTIITWLKMINSGLPPSESLCIMNILIFVWTCRQPQHKWKEIPIQVDIEIKL